MIEQIENYLSEISNEVKSHIYNEFKGGNERFSDYNTFDLVNFYLIYNYVINENNKKDLFINIPKDGYRDSLFSSVFHSLVFIKLYQNYFSFERKQPVLHKGDLIYCKSFKRVFEIVGIGKNGLSIKYKFPLNRDGRNKPFLRDGFNYTKVNPNLSRGRNTAKNINDYSRFLMDNFGGNFPFITDFKNKSLVVADKRFFDEAKHLPIRYTNRNGIIRKDLPFFNYLVECCNDFKTAQRYLLNTNNIFDEILVIGTSKYLQDFQSILHDVKYQGKVKNIILIGTNKPDTQNEFTKWLWSNYEVKLASEEKPNLPLKICLKNDLLYQTLVDLKNEIKDIEIESGANLSFMLKYTNFYFRMILVNTSLSKGIFEEYIDRLNCFFKSEKFEEELNRFFYENDEYNSETIQGYKERVLALFKEITTILQNKNLKWDYIKRQANKGKVLFLLVEKKNFDALNNQIKRERINNIKLISDKRIDNEKEYLDKWLKSSSNSQSKNIIVPYINNVELYNKLKAVNGSCEILCYEDIDEISYHRIVKSYEEEETSRLTHPDRMKFVKTDFNFIRTLSKKELSDLFDFDLKGDDIKNNIFEVNDLPKEKVEYEIGFADGSTEKFESTKGVFLVDNKELIKMNIGEIYIGSTIRFYQNTSPEEFKRILRIFDAENLLESFDKFSESWKTTLAKLSTKFNGHKALHDEMFNGNYKINYNTFRLYFDDYSQTRFPRLKTLELFRDFCKKNNFPDELIVKEFDKFKLYSKKDHSIRQQAGRLLSNDLLDYIASNKTEISDSLKKLSFDILNKLTETIQEKTVIRKRLIADE